MLKKRDLGYAKLIENKLKTLDQKIQQTLTVSTSQNIPDNADDAKEPLIDKYDVMRIFKISESSYYRKKHNWPTYQIGSKKLYKTSELYTCLKRKST